MKYLFMLLALFMFACGDVSAPAGMENEEDVCEECPVCEEPETPKCEPHWVYNPVARKCVIDQCNREETDNCRDGCMYHDEDNEIIMQCVTNF